MANSPLDELDRQLIEQLARDARVSNRKIAAALGVTVNVLGVVLPAYFGFASMVVNPFERMKLGSAIRESSLRREAPSYLTACGLAMRRFVQ